MSAFIVNDETINGVLHFLRRKNTSRAYVLHIGGKIRGDWNSNEPWQEVAQIIYAQNVRSVNYRYREQTNIGVFHYFYPPFAPTLSTVEALSAIDCIEYQSCETDDWCETEAYRILNSLRKCVIKTLPGYAEAGWGVYSDHPFARACAKAQAIPA